MESANRAVHEAPEIDGLDWTVCRYTDENHMRMMRSWELIVNVGQSEMALATARFRKYGQIFFSRYDPLLKIGRVQFYYKRDALAAMPSENCRMLPFQTVVVVRNLPFDVSESEILDVVEKHGTVLSLVFRDRHSYCRSGIVEVAYEREDEAFSLKNALHHATFRQHRLELNALNPKTSEAPVWKMQQRRYWVCFAEDMESVYEKCKTCGIIVDIRSDRLRTFVRFLLQADAERAAKSYGGCNPNSQEFASVLNSGYLEVVKVPIPPTSSEVNLGAEQRRKPVSLLIDAVPEGYELGPFLSDCRGCEIYLKEGRRMVNAVSKRALGKVISKLHRVGIKWALLKESDVSNETVLL
jgi:hypothetical protein